MSNEMPEKIWVGRHEDEGALGLGTLHVPRFMADFPELTEYTRTDTIADLRRQNAALKEYVMMVTDLALMEVPVDIIDIALEKEILKDVGENIGSRYAYPDWMLTDTAAMPKGDNQ